VPSVICPPEFFLTKTAPPSGRCSPHPYVIETPNTERGDRPEVGFPKPGGPFVTCRQFVEPDLLPEFRWAADRLAPPETSFSGCGESFVRIGTGGRSRPKGAPMAGWLQRSRLSGRRTRSEGATLRIGHAHPFAIAQNLGWSFAFCRTCVSLRKLRERAVPRGPGY